MTPFKNEPNNHIIYSSPENNRSKKTHTLTPLNSYSDLYNIQNVHCFLFASTTFHKFCARTKNHINVKTKFFLTEFFFKKTAAFTLCIWSINKCIEFATICHVNLLEIIFRYQRLNRSLPRVFFADFFYYFYFSVLFHIWIYIVDMLLMSTPTCQTC